MNKLKICSKCIYDETVPNISFNTNGVCSYCEQIDFLAEMFKTGTKKGEDELFSIIDKIKKEGKNKKYDCAVGVSGGTDSSYLLAKVVEWGLRPLAVHYDNTWNTAIATENIRKVTSKLNVDLFTIVTSNDEADDLLKSFFISGTSDLDAPTDLALSETMYRAASKYNLKYVIEGHSFKAEGVSPLSNSYVDGKYIEQIHKEFGKLKKLKSFPNMKFLTFLKWVFIKRIKKIRPLWYINYSKQEAMSFLEKEFDWKYYGGHHLENRIAAFSHSYFLPTRFNIDQRNNSISASVRSGIISREEGLELYKQEPYLEPELLNYFKKRLKLTDEEFETIMNSERKSYKDFKTYKKRFELFRPFFLILAKVNLVPMSFYLKYCLQVKNN
jgi:N-acetyl sugar amidotransferase